MRNGTEVTSSNVVGDSDDKNNFPHKLLLTNTQVSRLRKVQANDSSANTKLSKTQLHEIQQSEGFLGKLLGPLLKYGLPIMKNVLKPLAKGVLIPLGLTGVTSATDVAIHKNMFVSRNPLNLAFRSTTLIFSNEEMNDIIKIVKSLEEYGLFIKGATETIKYKAKEQILKQFSPSLLETLLTRNRVKKSKIPGQGVMRAGKELIRAGQDS